MLKHLTIALIVALYELIYQSNLGQINVVQGIANKRYTYFESRELFIQTRGVKLGPYGVFKKGSCHAQCRIVIIQPNRVSLQQKKLAN